MKYIFIFIVIALVCMGVINFFHPTGFSACLGWLNAALYFGWLHKDIMRD
jgi:hypothetical protein